MAEPALAVKAKRKSGGRAAIINAPAGYARTFFAGLERAADSLVGSFDWIRIFVRNEAELTQIAPRAAKALKAEGMLWISFPERSSKIQTNLTRDKGWDSLKMLNLKWVNLISINETWSAFALRPYRPGEKRTQAWS